MDEKLKSDNMQKTAVFYFFLLYIENGAMLTTYLFRYTPECTISKSNFQTFLRLRWQGGIDPPNQNPVDVPAPNVTHAGALRFSQTKQNRLSHRWSFHR